MKKVSENVLEAKEQFSMFENEERDTSSTFQDNLSLPIHRWYRYSAGYSAEWVESVLRNANASQGSTVFDPFAGSGTTLIAAQKYGCIGYGNEAQSFVYKICDAKLNWVVDPDKFKEASNRLLKIAQKKIKSIENPPDLISRCYSEETIEGLYALKSAYFEIEKKEQEDICKLLWLGITSILRSTSSVGTAQWQYLLPNRQKKNPKLAFAAFEEKINQMLLDIRFAQNSYKARIGRVDFLDSQDEINLPDNSVDFMITSPPYPNNYDYADATRLELVFWEDLTGWSGLHSIRKNLVCSCSQHSAAERYTLEGLLSSEYLSPIREEITKVCTELAEIRMEKGGKKTYHTMIAAYYLGISKLLVNLRRVMKKDSTLVFVIGDSAPYGVYAPADKWYIDLAISAGFSSPVFDKIRDRNTKWKNRKHTVPLKEGRLWLKG